MALLKRFFGKFAKQWNRFLKRLQLPEADSITPRLKSIQSYDDLSSTLNAIPDLMFELDEDGRHWDFRAIRTELLVAPPEELLGYTVTDVMPAEAAQTVMAALKETIEKGYSQGTHIYLPTPIGDRWFEVSMARKEKIEGEPPRFIALSRDITERKLKLIEAERLAYIDALTELPNRHWIEERLKSSFIASQQSGQFCALLFIDLDNFKSLNDSRGHHVGDLLLQVIAQRLRAALRKGDLIARWGGDEFIVLIQNLGKERNRAIEVIKLVCEQLSDRLNTPYDLEGQPHDSQASIGVNLFNGQEQDIEQVIQQADSAMYSAKQENRGHYVFYNA